MLKDRKLINHYGKLIKDYIHRVSEYVYINYGTFMVHMCNLKTYNRFVIRVTQAKHMQILFLKFIK